MTAARAVRLGLAADLLSTAIACGGSAPASPSQSALPFRTGPYAVSFLAAEAISSASTGLVAACPGVSKLGVAAVDLTVTLQPDGTGWTGRPSTPANGDFEIHFEYAGANDREILVSATARGTAIDGGSPIPSPGQLPGVARIMLGSAQLTGSVIRSGIAGGGMVTTTVAFGNLTGDTAACAPNTVPWFISRLGL